MAGPKLPAPGTSRSDWPNGARPDGARPNGARPNGARPNGAQPSCNILGPTALGFRHRDDVREVTQLLDRLGIAINVVAPLGATPADLARLGEADFNVVLYPEVADTAARWLERSFKQPRVTTVPIGVGATKDFIAELRELGFAGPPAAGFESDLRLPWYSPFHRLDLSDRQAGLHLRRRDPCRRRSARRVRGTRV